MVATAIGLRKAAYIFGIKGWLVIGRLVLRMLRRRCAELAAGVGQHGEVLRRDAG